MGPVNGGAAPVTLRLSLLVFTVSGCYSPDVEAAAAGDAPGSACRNLPAVTEDFGEALNASEWLPVGDAGTSWDLVDGQLVLHLGAGSVEQGRQIALYALGSFSLIASRLSVEVPIAPAAGPLAEAALVVYQTADDAVAVEDVAGVLRCGQRVAGAYSMVCTPEYDRVMHRFWALREDQGFVRYESSVDGVTWNPLFSTVSSIALAGPAMHIGVYAFMTEAGADPIDSHFDNFLLCPL
jgi:hypothetical protein